MGTYTMVAANRQGRPHLPKGQCPFCPGSGKVPDQYEVLVYDNDFPALTKSPEAPDPLSNSPYQVEPNYGKCEVILYSSQHDKSLYHLSLSHIEKLVGVWKDRFTSLAADAKVKYIYPFENKGEEIGATIHHPHGQLYAYPFLPQKIEVELQNCKSYYQEHGRSLLQDMNAAELESGERIIFENDSFISYIPHFTDYPFGVFIVSKLGTNHLGAISDSEQRDLASMLKHITGAFDQLFNKPFPYMMCVHQTPVNLKEYDDTGDYYDLHIEFYPPLRSADKIKWMASSESGAGAAANTAFVEDSAKQLREALYQFKQRGDIDW